MDAWLVDPRDRGRIGTDQVESDQVESDRAISHWGTHAYPREIQDRVWENGALVSGNDPALWRKDEFGAWIHRLEYGNRRSDYGWEILEPTNDSLIVMRPLQWQNYVDQVAAHTQSRVTAAGLHNTRRLL